MQPASILEAQNEFLHRYEALTGFRTYIRGCFAPAIDVASDEQEMEARYFTKNLLDQFRHGDTYRVTPEMCDLLTFSAHKLDASDRYSRDMPPSTWGVVRFEKALPIWDARGQMLKASWATWGPMTLRTYSPLIRNQMVDRAGTFVTMWSDAITDPDDVDIVLRMWYAPDRDFVRKNIGRWGFIGTQFLVDGERVGDVETTLTPEFQQEMLARDNLTRLYAEEHQEVYLAPPPPVGSHTNVGRYFHALWLLLDQVIVDVREETLPRSASKRIGLMPIPGKISVVNLRRREHRQSPGETYVEWQHRWVVKGHWRWQPYGEGREQVRRIWIHPYIKGPEDKPFIQTRKVYNLKR